MIQEKYIEEYKKSQEKLQQMREVEAKMKEGTVYARLEIIVESASKSSKSYIDLSPTVAERALNNQHTAVYNRVETLDKLIAEDLRK